MSEIFYKDTIHAQKIIYFKFLGQNIAKSVSYFLTLVHKHNKSKENGEYCV